MTPETGTTSAPASSRHDTAIHTETVTEPLLSAGHTGDRRGTNAPGSRARPRPSANSAGACSPEGALPAKTKQLIAVAVAHVTQCPYCIRSHTQCGAAAGSNPRGDHGGHLGSRGDACWRCLRAFGAGARHDRSTTNGPADVSAKVAINGLGRIGRAVLKLCRRAIARAGRGERPDRCGESAYLLRFDTVYGRYGKSVAVNGGIWWLPVGSCGRCASAIRRHFPGGSSESTRVRVHGSADAA